MADDHVVHEAVGAPIAPLAAGAALYLGVLALLISGEIPILLGGFADQHRLSISGIGMAAAAEGLTMAAAAALAGLFLPPRHLRLVAAAASLALALSDWSVARASGDIAVVGLRAVAGIPEGVLLWITIGMISRSVLPERWAAVLATLATGTQLASSALLSAGLLTRLGSSGVFELFAAVSLTGAVVALAAPRRYAPLAAGDQVLGNNPPARGWAALAATFVFLAADGAVGVYIAPLAQAARLTAETAQTAISWSLVAQLAGSAMAVVLAGRVGYFAVFVFGVAGQVVCYLVYGLLATNWIFEAITAMESLGVALVTPFLVPMTIEADPTRRAALQIGAVQVLGAACGPLMASLLVSGARVTNVLWLGSAMALVSLAIVIGLRVRRAAVA
jgi:predicted MFS family arabinose efflux permease